MLSCDFSFHKLFAKVVFQNEEEDKEELRCCLSFSTLDGQYCHAEHMPHLFNSCKEVYEGELPRPHNWPDSTYLPVYEEGNGS